MEPFLSEKQQTSECPDLPGQPAHAGRRIPRCEQFARARTISGDAKKPERPEQSVNNAVLSDQAKAGAIILNHG